MTKDDCFLLGKITKPFSFRGEVVLWMDVDDPAPYVGSQTLWISQQNMLVPYTVETWKPNKDRYVVRLSDVLTEAHAKSLAGKDVYLPLTAMPPLEDGKFYFHEVQGWAVGDLESRALLGRILHVVDQGAYPMLEVHFDAGADGYIPLPDHVDVEVDRNGQTLYVELPDGLVDVYLGGNDDGDDRDDRDDRDDLDGFDGSERGRSIG